MTQTCSTAVVAIVAKDLPGLLRESTLGGEGLLFEDVVLVDIGQCLQLVGEIQCWGGSGSERRIRACRSDHGSGFDARNWRW